MGERRTLKSGLQTLYPILHSNGGSPEVRRKDELSWATSDPGTILVFPSPPSIISTGILLIQSFGGGSAGHYLLRHRPAIQKIRMKNPESLLWGFLRHLILLAGGALSLYPPLQPRVRCREPG